MSNIGLINLLERFPKVPSHIYLCPPYFLWGRPSQTHSTVHLVKISSSREQHIHLGAPVLSVDQSAGLFRRPGHSQASRAQGLLYKHTHDSLSH